MVKSEDTNNGESGGGTKLKLSLPIGTRVPITDRTKQAAMSTMSSRKAVAIGKSGGTGADVPSGSRDRQPPRSGGYSGDGSRSGLTMAEKEARREALSNAAAAPRPETVRRHAVVEPVVTPLPEVVNSATLIAPIGASAEAAVDSEPEVLRKRKEAAVKEPHGHKYKEKSEAVHSASKEEERLSKSKEFKVKKKYARDVWEDAVSQLYWYGKSDDIVASTDDVALDASPAPVDADITDLTAGLAPPQRAPRGRKRSTSRRQQRVPARSEPKSTSSVLITGSISAADLASKMSVKQDKVVRKMNELGLDSTKPMDAEEAAIIASEFGHSFEIALHSDILKIFDYQKNDPEGTPRPPVVTIMGHVDHGKTSLLDSIRNTDVAAGEAGGITQHIGAYQITTPTGNLITFLDTPGHEAFTKMRSRGANVTDIVVLVVAADDGVMPQTVEAINHAKAAGVPIVLAINKVDRPGADPNKIRSAMAQYDVLDESLGGDVISVPVSALRKTNIDKLEEAIIITAEMLELKACSDGSAKGAVLEAKLDKQRGIAVTLLTRHGSLRRGDVLVAGESYCRVRNMMDHHGKSVDIAMPSTPVEILGFNSMPKAGDRFAVVRSEQEARNIIAQYTLLNKSTDDMIPALTFMQQGKHEANFVVKADTAGSAQVIRDYISKIQHEELLINIVHSGVGKVTESDIALACIAKATIVMFNLPSDAAMMRVAQNKGVPVMNYNVIYHLFDDVRARLALMLSPIMHEKVIGTAVVRQVFDLYKFGNIAGCLVTSGSIKRNANVRLKRADLIIYNGKVNTLKHYKENVDEVKNGMECGIAFDRWTDIEEGDVISAYQVTEEKQKI